MVGDSLSSDIRGRFTNYAIDTCWYNPGGKINQETQLISITHEIRDLTRAVLGLVTV